MNNAAYANTCPVAKEELAYNSLTPMDECEEDIVYEWKANAKFDPSKPYNYGGYISDATENFAGSVVEGKLLFLIATDAEADDILQAVNDYKAACHAFLIKQAKAQIAES